MWVIFGAPGPNMQFSFLTLNVFYAKTNLFVPTNVLEVVKISSMIACCATLSISRRLASSRSSHQGAEHASTTSQTYGSNR